MVFSIESCVDEISYWMMVNCFKLNKDKIELLVIFVKYFLRLFFYEILVVGEIIFFV